MGYSDENIVVDSVLTSASTLSKIDAKELKSVGMLLRYLDVSSFYGSMDGLLRAKFAYPNVQFRYAIAPSQKLPWNWLPLSLTTEQVSEMIALGE